MVWGKKNREGTNLDHRQHIKQQQNTKGGFQSTPKRKEGNDNFPFKQHPQTRFKIEERVK